MVRVRWLKISSIIVDDCLHEYVIRGKKMNCKDFVPDLIDFVHNPYRCGPLRVVIRLVLKCT